MNTAEFLFLASLVLILPIVFYILSSALYYWLVIYPKFFRPLLSDYLRKKIKIEEIEYFSGEVGPLYANCIYEDESKNRPLVVYMHGYSSNRSREISMALHVARKGFFVVCPDMRGKGPASSDVNLSRFNVNSTDLGSFGMQNDFYARWNEINWPYWLLGNPLRRKLLQQFKYLTENHLLKSLKSKGVIQTNVTLSNSQGMPDDGYEEILDIYEAIECVKLKYANYIDNESIHIMGMSGGGGNVYSAVTKIPYLFSTAASFFGISDYSYWYDHANTSSRENFREMMRKHIGGTPNELPIKYKIRNSVLGAKNNNFTKFYLFWDEYEVQCPGHMNLAYYKQALIHGMDNIVLKESRIIDQARALHVFPFPSQLKECVNIYLNAIDNHTICEKKYEETNEYVILGFLLTDKFYINFGEDVLVSVVEKKLEAQLILTFRVIDGLSNSFGKILFKNKPFKIMESGNTLIPTETKSGWLLENINPSTNLYISYFQKNLCA